MVDRWSRISGDEQGANNRCVLVISPSKECCGRGLDKGLSSSMEIPTVTLPIINVGLVRAATDAGSRTTVEGEELR
jgi:hypothetical protein